MVPVAHLLVSYIREDGELVSDSLDIEVEGIFQNFVSKTCESDIPFYLSVQSIATTKSQENNVF